LFSIQVLVTDPAKLARIREAEGDITRARIELMLKAGANVILTTKGMDDMAMKYVLCF
jgi:T-complex protein 1 subunit alpha